MNELTLRMILRATICFKDIGLFTTAKQNQKMYGTDYSGNHIAIFECELKQPPQIVLVDHTFAQILQTYKMNMRNWKIVDIDNYMNGNSLFPTILNEQIW